HDQHDPEHRRRVPTPGEAPARTARRPARAPGPHGTALALAFARSPPYTRDHGELEAGLPRPPGRERGPPRPRRPGAPPGGRRRAPGAGVGARGLAPPPALPPSRPGRPPLGCRSRARGGPRSRPATARPPERVPCAGLRARPGPPLARSERPARSDPPADR